MRIFDLIRHSCASLVPAQNDSYSGHSLALRMIRGPYWLRGTCRDALVRHCMLKGESDRKGKMQL